LEATHFSEAVNEVFECWTQLNRHFLPDNSESVKSLKWFIEVTARTCLEEVSTPGRNFREIQARLDKFRALAEEVDIGLHSLTEIYDDAQRILCRVVLNKVSYAKDLLLRNEFLGAADIADEFVVAQECEIQSYVPPDLDVNIDKHLDSIVTLLRESLDKLHREILGVLSGQMPPESELARLREKWTVLRECTLSDAVTRHAGEELVSSLYETLKNQMTDFVASVNIFAADDKITQSTHEILTFLKKLTMLQEFDPQVKEQLAKCRTQILSRMTQKVLKKRSDLKVCLTPTYAVLTNFRKSSTPNLRISRC
jgi:hypothetical protein